VDETSSAANPAANALQNINATTTSSPSMVIRVGQAFIEVEKVDPAILRIRQLAAQVGGYIANSSVSGGRDQIRQATLEVKIPASKYDQAVGDLSTIGKVETVNSTAEDVGEEFVDVTARVNNARRLEERLITLLSTRTGKLDEVLRVERELARVREEIERYEGRLRFLSMRAATSTLTITVHEPAPILGSSPGQNPIAAALRRAWKNFVALLAGIIASLGVVIPLALIGFAGWVGYRRWKKREESQR
jgi:predicted negative regulator of RcsB-dependent stress response